MAIDFRSSQVQVNKLIASGTVGGLSIASGSQLVVYPIETQDTSTPNQGEVTADLETVFGSLNDVFFFVSGAIGGKDDSDHTISVFGGDLHISGNLTVDGTNFISGNLRVANESTSIDTSINSLTGKIALGESAVFGFFDGFVMGYLNPLAPSENTMMFGFIQNPYPGDSSTTLGTMLGDGGGDNITITARRDATAALTSSFAKINIRRGGIEKGLTVTHLSTTSEWTTLSNSDFFDNKGTLISSGSFIVEGGVINTPSIHTTNYVATASDYVILVGAVAPTLIELPIAPKNGQTYIIKDANGTSSIFNITVSSSMHNIDGASTYVLGVNYASVTVTYSTAFNAWSVI